MQDPNIFQTTVLLISQLNLETGLQKIINQISVTMSVANILGKNDLKNDFVERLCSTNATEKLILLNVNIVACSDDHEIQSCVTGLVGIVEQAAEPLFKKFVQPKMMRIMKMRCLLVIMKSRGSTRSAISINITFCLCLISTDSQTQTKIE